MARFAENLWEEFVFEVLLGLNFSHQPNVGQGATKQRHQEKAGTIVKVLWPQMVLFVSCGGFSAIFCVVRNDT